MTWLLAVVPGLCFGVVLFNVVTWSRAWPRAWRGTPCAPHRARVSVLIPARNEERNLRDCLLAVLATPAERVEVCVYDDQSTDRSAEIVQDFAARDPRVRYLAGTALPAGWLGKPHACQRLADAARGDILVFLDADVRLSGAGLSQVVAALEAYDVVTAVPQQQMETFFEKLLLPLLHVTYLAWLPLAIIPRTKDPRVLAANGQLMALSRDTLVRLDGFRGIARAVVDDMAFCRRAKQHGLRVALLDGDALATCRMYRSLSEIWNGFSKNLYPGLGAKPRRLCIALALNASAFVIPYMAAVTSIWLDALQGPAWLGVVFNLHLRLLIGLRHRQPLWSAFLHPVAVLFLLAMALNSFRWTQQGQLRWAGRTYEGACV